MREAIEPSHGVAFRSCKLSYVLPPKNQAFLDAQW